MPLPNATWEQQLLKSTFFNELPSGKSVPRSICIDLDPRSIHDISGSRLGKLFHPDNLICSENGQGMKGYMMNLGVI